MYKIYTQSQENLFTVFVQGSSPQMGVAVDSAFKKILLLAEESLFSFLGVRCFFLVKLTRKLVLNKHREQNPLFIVL